MCLYSNVFLYICTNEKFKHSQMDSNADMTPIRLVIFREALWCSIESGYLTKDLRTPSRCRQWWARGVQFVADTFPACDEPPGDVTRRWQAITNDAEFSLQHLIWACLCLGWLRYLNPDELTWRDMPLDNFSILQDLGVDKKRTIYLKTLTVGIFQSQRNASTWERHLRRQKI